MIEVAAYQTLVKNKKIKIFFLIISKINKALSSVEDFAKLNEIIFVMSLNELKKKLLIVYHDFLNVFDREKTTQLFLHWSYNHKIKLEDESQSLLWAYQDWIELVSVFSSDLTQSLFSFINISLFNIIFLSTSHSTRVTNTSSSSLVQSLNIT